MGKDAAAGTGTPDAGAAGKTPETLAGTAAAIVEGTGAAAAAAGASDGTAKVDDKKVGDTAAAAATTGEKKTPAAEAKPESKDGAAAAAPKAPEKYALTVPEGGRIDADDVKAVEEIARESGWTNDQAQQALESHADALAAQSARFLTATKADPTYGGDQLATTQQRALAVLEKVRPAGTPRGDALRALLNKSGYGNHLEVISFLADLGTLMAEDGHVAGASGGSTARDPVSVLYGDSA